MSTKPSMQNLNVYKKPLALFSRSPMTGFFRDGYCRTGPGDGGNHAVAGVVTDAFLDFSAARGNDLRAAAGLAAGCKWCLCAGRWREAVRAAGEMGEEVVPRVFLHATHESALKDIDLADLKRFAAEGEEGHSEKRGVASTTGRGNTATTGQGGDGKHGGAN